MSGPRRAGWDRVAWSGVGQALSSITNFGLGAALVANGSTADLGRAMSVVSVYYVALTVGRALYAESLVAALDPSVQHWNWVRRRLLIIGTLAGPAALAVGVMVGLDLVGVLVIALAQPTLMLQDGYRYLAWSRDRPSRAAAIDLVWVAVSAAATGFAWATGLAFDTVTIAAIWALGGTLSALFALPLAGGRIAEAGGHRTRRRSADTHRQLAHSQSLLTASFNLVPVVLALLVSAETAGLAKAVVLPFGPWLALVGGLRMVTLPAVTAWNDHPNPGRGPSPALIQAGVLLPVSLVAALLSAWLTRLVADRMDPLRDAVPYLLFGVGFCVLFVVGQVLSDGLALGPTRRAAVKLRILTLGIEWVGLFGGAVLGGPTVMLSGWLIGMTVGVAVWWLATARSGGAAADASRLGWCSPVHQQGPFPTPPVPTSSRTPMAG